MTESPLLPPLDDRGPARPLDPAAEERMVLAALAAFDEGAAVAAPRRRWRTRTAVVVGLGLATSLAAAGILERVWRSPPAEVAKVPPPAPRPPPPAVTPEATPRPSAVPGRPRARPRPAPAAVAPPSPKAAEDALVVANRLRGQREFRAAERAYLGVVTAHPGTSAAEVARIAAASLRLEHLGDPKGALALYRAAVERPGRFGAEAWLGLADAHRALGDRQAEREALLRVIADHPESVEARTARSRLGEVGR